MRPAGLEGTTYVLIEDILRSELAVLFPGQEIREAAVFRVARDAELDFDDEGGGDLLEVIEEELKNRRRSGIVRLEIEAGVGEEMIEVLADRLSVGPEDTYRVKGPLDIRALFALVDLPSLEDLRDPPQKPLASVEVPPEGMFALLDERDVLLVVDVEAVAIPAVNKEVGNPARADKLVGVKRLQHDRQDVLRANALKAFRGAVVVDEGVIVALELVVIALLRIEHRLVGQVDRDLGAARPLFHDRYAVVRRAAQLLRPTDEAHGDELVRQLVQRGPHDVRIVLAVDDGDRPHRAVTSFSMRAVYFSYVFVSVENWMIFSWP